MDIFEFITGKVSPDLKPLAELSLLLERLERLPRGASPDQYREVVLTIQGMLGKAKAGAALDEVLQVFPATAELYENLNYAHAGLCRSNQGAAVEAELAVRGLFTKKFATG